MVIYPTLSLNGTEARQLIASYRAAHESLEVALRMVGQCHPHERDYIGRSLSFTAATNDHNTRMAKLEKVRAEIEDLAVHVARDARQQRRTAA